MGMLQLRRDDLNRRQAARPGRPVWLGLLGLLLTSTGRWTNVPWASQLPLVRRFFSQWVWYMVPQAVGAGQVRGRCLLLDTAELHFRSQVPSRRVCTWEITGFGALAKTSSGEAVTPGRSGRGRVPSVLCCHCSHEVLHAVPRAPVRRRGDGPGRQDRHRAAHHV